MPALVNYGGDDEFYSGLYSIGSRADIYSPPCKRARINAPFMYGSSEFEQNKQPSIEVLPDECLFEIFKRISGGKERSSCASVSKRWLLLLSSIRRSEICQSKSLEAGKKTEDPVSDDVNMVSYDENGEIECEGHLTRSLDGKKATDLRLAAIAVGTSSRGGLGKLVIRGSNYVRGVTNLGLMMIARGCPTLRSLTLWNVPLVGDEGLFEIAKECHHLEKFDLSHCPSISNKGLIAIAEMCPNLISLCIDSCAKIGNEGLQSIGKLCPKLQFISITDCPLVGDHGLSSLLASSSSLTKVKLQSLRITDFSLAVLGHYGKNVTNLTLSGLQHVSEKGFWVMGNAQGLQKLTALTISTCRGVTDVSLEAIAKGCTNLKQMHIRRCSFVSDNGLVAFAKTARSLETLQLEECNRFTQCGILGAIAVSGSKLKALSLMKCMKIKDTEMELPESLTCTSLRSLSIRNCPGFGNASLAAVAKLFPRLEQLDLSGLCGITDAGLIPLLDSCEAGLVKLNLSGCMSLTDSVVSTLARLHGSTLEVLNLDGCRKITNASLVAIAENCMFLSDLDVSKSAITDAGISALSNSEQLCLQILALSGCSGVSNKSLSSLKKIGRTLVGLNLQNCNSISSNTVGSLIESLWRCEILF